MKYNEFVPAAIRTESRIDEVMLERRTYNALVSSILSLADNLDLIKKNVFYDKPIDQDRFRNNITEVSHQLKSYLGSDQILDNNPESTEAVKVNPRVFHGCIGMVTEAVELLELINLDEEFPDRLKICDEMGDSSYYGAIICDEMSLDMETDVLAGVIAKLQKRFPDKFDAALAINRNKEVELQATNKVLIENQK